VARRPELAQERIAISYDHAAVTADTTVKLWSCPTGRAFRVMRVFYCNPTGLAADATNYFNLKILKGAATVAANWSTLTGQQGALGADTPVEFTLSSTDADRVLQAGDALSLFLDETGTQTLPAGRVVVEGCYV
jgi:hypothetical protein